MLKENYVKIIVYYVLGREVATLVDEMKSPGTYEVKFNASHAESGGMSDRSIASGVYFYTIRTGDFLQSKKMILLR